MKQSVSGFAAPVPWKKSGDQQPKAQQLEAPARFSIGSLPDGTCQKCGMMEHRPGCIMIAPRWEPMRPNKFPLSANHGSEERVDRRAAVWRKGSSDLWSAGRTDGAGSYTATPWSSHMLFRTKGEAKAYADKTLAKEDAAKNA